jgi:hypothetical protein
MGIESASALSLSCIVVALDAAPPRALPAVVVVVVVVVVVALVVVVVVLAGSVVLVEGVPCWAIMMRPASISSSTGQIHTI